MRNFRDAYRSAVEELPKPSITITKVTDELYHHGRTVARKRRTWMSVIAAACVFLVCGAGTVAAVHYKNSVVEIAGDGFSFTNMEHASQEAAIENPPPSQELTGSPAMARALDEGSPIPQMQETVQVLEAEPVEQREYFSIEEFEAQEEITISIPDLDWLGDTDLIQEENIMITEDGTRVCIRVAYPDDVLFVMQVADNREYSNYATRNIYSGEVVNERTYTNSQGLVYQVFDSQEDGELIATHAGMSVNGRDITLGFFGFGVEMIEKVLFQLDMSVYLTE